jgi:hypothetical protein
MTEDEIDELREQTRGSDRISAEVSDGESEDVEESLSGGDATGKQTDASGDKTEDENPGPTPSSAFADALQRRAERANTGVDPQSVSADDPGLSAFLLALQDTGEIDEVGEALREAVGARQPPEYDRDAVVRLALTYALSEETPAYFEELASP